MSDRTVKRNIVLISQDVSEHCGMPHFVKAVLEQYVIDTSTAHHLCSATPNCWGEFVRHDIELHEGVEAEDVERDLDEFEYQLLLCAVAGGYFPWNYWEGRTLDVYGEGDPDDTDEEAIEEAREYYCCSFYC